MAKNIINGIEYEKEPHPNFQIDGKPVYYAKNVPDLLRDLTEENCDFALNDPDLEAFDKQVKKCPLATAEQGVVKWNRWIQWAQLSDERWCHTTVKNDRIYVAMHTPEGSLQQNDYFTKNGLDFRTGQTVKRRGNYVIETAAFSYFVFPCPVSFAAATFSGDALFDGATFSGPAWFHGATFGETVSFNDSTFGSDVRFDDSTFNRYVWFDRARFGGEAGFNGASFGKTFICRHAAFLGDARFDNTLFNKAVDFSSSQFLMRSIFANVQIKANANFEHVYFGKTHATPKPQDFKLGSYDANEVTPESKTIPDFRSAQFAIAPNLGYTHVAPIPAPECPLPWYQKWAVDSGLAWKIKDENAASKLRRLQELAGEGHHHLAEKRFFRAELLARRGHEAKTWRENTMINLFELFSECGMSFRRPMGWLAGVTVLSALFYSTQIDWPAGDSGGFELFSYSIANSLPLLGYISDSYGVSVEVLFDGIENVPGGVRVWAFMQNAVSAILIFFGLLAIRNYFKLG